MPKKPYKKPTLKQFNETLKKTGGHLTNTAALLGVNRSTLWEWAKVDPQFESAIRASRKKMLDDAVMTANIVALGIPIKDNNGRVVGWEVPPDASMLRYLMSTLGRDEDFGEEMTMRHTADEGIDVSRWIEWELAEKKKRASQQAES